MRFTVAILCLMGVGLAAIVFTATNLHDPSARPTSELTLVALILLEILGGAALLVRHDRLLARAKDEARQRRKQQMMADALRRSDERCHTIVEASHDVICTVDKEGIITFCNRRAEEFTGYARSEVVGHGFARFIHPEDLPAIQQAFVDTIAGISRTCDARVLAKDGRTLTLAVKSVPHYEDEVVVGAVSLGRDVTSQMLADEENRKWKAQFLQAQKMETVGRLAGGVAHDFNNMLTVIIGQADMAMQKLPADSPVRADIKTIEEAAERSADLTRRLLGFARKQVISPRGLDLNVTITAMMKMLGRLIGENIALTWNPGMGLWPVKVDPGQIDQILVNAVVNGRDAISGAGNVTIRTANVVLDATFCESHLGSIAGEYVRLSISDTGSGMDADTLRHIFEPFFTTKPLGKGTGLGLATVYGIVKQNNGYIDVTSYPDRGTNVCIYLPRSDAKVVEQPLAVDRSEVRGTETLLLVEDEGAILNLVKPALEDMGYTVLAALTPSGGLALAKRYAAQIHLLITDVVMPEMSGREFKRRLDDLRSGSRCLFMSGYGADVLTDDGVLEEGVSFLQKPFSVKELVHKVREVLAN